MRLPDVSTSTAGYCNAILRKAEERTMPTGLPNDPAMAGDRTRLDARCNSTSVANLCKPDNAKVCAQAGGYCVKSVSSSSFRHDICRWPLVATSADCTATAGGRWVSRAAFAADWPDWFPAGVNNVCISQMYYLGGHDSTVTSSCDTTQQDTCRNLGAVCERHQVGAGGPAPGAFSAFCRWPDHTNVSSPSCATAGGTWLTDGAAVDLQFPTVLRKNTTAGCVKRL
jgi:hypothetical protein